MIVRAAFISAIMMAVALGTALVRPPPVVVSSPDLEAMLPEAFGEWRRVKLGAAILPAEAELQTGEAVAYRAYRDHAGRIITLVAAYGPPLGDSVRLHRPESCYVAQGFAIAARSVKPLRLGDGTTPVVRLNTQNTTRNEAVSYWLRDGDAYIDHAYGRGVLDVIRGFSSASDGALVRVSSKGASKTAFDMHEDFMRAFVDALSPEARALLMAPPR